MLIPSHILNWLITLKIFLVLNAYGINVQFFKQEQFTDLLWESSSNSKCNNAPSTKMVDVYSIKTDTCIIAYFNADCKSQWTVKYLPGDINLTENDLTWIESFHTCSEEEGGSQLNVDIFKLDESLVAEVLHSYKKVCSCVNIPEYMQNMDKWAIDNHHNSFLAYYEPDCSESKLKAKFMVPGHNLESNSMNEVKETDNVTEITYKIQSFGPDPESVYSQTTCKTYNATTENPRRNAVRNISPNRALNAVPNTVSNPLPYAYGSTYPNSEYVGSYQYGSTTERHMDPNIDLNERIQIMSNQFVELRTKIDQSTKNVENMHYGFLKQHKEEFSKLSEKITELHHGIRTFNEKVKYGLHELVVN